MKPKRVRSKEPRRINKKRSRSSPAKPRRTPPIKKLRRIAANARATLRRCRTDAKKRHKGLLTVAQAAAIYRVIPNTVYKWCQAGLKKKRQAGIVFLNPKAIQKYLLFGRKRRR